MPKYSWRRYWTLSCSWWNHQRKHLNIGENSWVNDTCCIKHFRRFSTMEKRYIEVSQSFEYSKRCRILKQQETFLFSFIVLSFIGLYCIHVFMLFRPNCDATIIMLQQSNIFQSSVVQFRWAYVYCSLSWQERYPLWSSAAVACLL